ncbi:oxygenase MpaB family protein [Nocardia sp. NPDC055321]
MTRLVSDHMWQGDELMDAVVVMFRRVGPAKGRKWLDQALEEGIDSLTDPPEELVALFEHLDTPPSWHDPAAWDRGRAAWTDSSFLGKFGMALIDTAYTTMRYDVSSATGSTRWFEQNALFRNRDSAAWFASLGTPGSMERFAEPFKNTVRVRLMHSQVRYGLRQSLGPEAYAERGNPIPNSTMAGGIGAFGLSPLLIDQHLGRKVTDSDLEDVNKFFGYILYVFGVSEDIIPRNFRDAIILTDYVAALGGTPGTEFSVQLNRVFMEFIAELTELFAGPLGGRVAEKVLTPLLMGYAHFLLGETLTKEMLRSRGGIGAARMKMLAALARGLAATDARVKGYRDQLPGARERRMRAAAHGDRALNKTVMLLEMAIAKRDAALSDAPTFAGHDTSTDGQFAQIN